MPVWCKHMQAELHSKLNSTEVHDLLLCLSEIPVGCRLRWQTTIGPSHSVNFKTENKLFTYLLMEKPCEVYMKQYLDLNSAQEKPAALVWNDWTLGKSGFIQTNHHANFRMYIYISKVV